MKSLQKLYNFLDIMVTESNRNSLESKDRFKLKREMRDDISKSGIDPLLADDLASFIVEKTL